WMASHGKTQEQIDKVHSGFEASRVFVIVGMIWVIGYFDGVIFKDLFDDLKEMFINAGWVYFAFAVIFSLVLFRIMERLGEVEEAAQKTEADKVTQKTEADTVTQKTEADKAIQKTEADEATQKTEADKATQ